MQLICTADPSAGIVGRKVRFSVKENTNPAAGRSSENLKTVVTAKYAPDQSKRMRGKKRERPALNAPLIIEIRNIREENYRCRNECGRQPYRMQADFPQEICRKCMFIQIYCIPGFLFRKREGFPNNSVRLLECSGVCDFRYQLKKHMFVVSV